MKAPKEGDLVKAALAYLQGVLGLFCWRCNTGAFSGKYKGKRCFVRFGTPGCPDIIGWTRGGRFFGVECKTAKGKQTAAQKVFQGTLEYDGGIYVLARTLDDVIDGLHV